MYPIEKDTRIYDSCHVLRLAASLPNWVPERRELLPHGFGHAQLQGGAQPAIPREMEYSVYRYICIHI